MNDEPKQPLDDLDATLQGGPMPMPRRLAGEDSAEEIGDEGVEATIVRDASTGESDDDPVESTLIQADEGVEPTAAGAAPAVPKAKALPKHLPTIPDVILEGVLGTGGQGAVYRGHQEYLERTVAVKILHRQVDPKFSQRFQREAKILAGLLHPNIVVCHQAGVAEDDHCYMVMEFIDGPDLHQEVKKSGPLTEREALSVLLDVTRALAHGHESAIIHRDVKPQNVLLQAGTTTSNGQRFRAKLADLGLARCMEDGTDMPELTAQGAVMGTPSTMAPEQFDNPDAVDHRTDIYGLGCVLFFAVTGEPAFEGATFTDIYQRKTQRPLQEVVARATRVSDGTRALLRSLLAPAAKDRPQSYAELIEAIEKVANGQKPQLKTAKSGSKRASILAGAGVAAAAAVALALTLNGGDEDSTGTSGKAAQSATEGAAPPADLAADSAGGAASEADADTEALARVDSTDGLLPDPAPAPGAEPEPAALGASDHPQEIVDTAGPQDGESTVERSAAARLAPGPALDTGVTLTPFTEWSVASEMFRGWLIEVEGRFGGDEDILTTVTGYRSVAEARPTASRPVPTGPWSLSGEITISESMVSGPAFGGGLELVTDDDMALVITVAQPASSSATSLSPVATAAWRLADGTLGEPVFTAETPRGIEEDADASQMRFTIQQRSSQIKISVNGSNMTTLQGPSEVHGSFVAMTLFVDNGVTLWRDFVFTGL